LRIRVLGKIFGPNRENITTDWGKLHTEELRGLYPSPNIAVVTNQEGWDRWGVWNVWRRGDVNIGFC
jgi:hypothetical protein